jgi:general nucleoside transport system ATP-binding protein
MTGAVTSEPPIREVPILEAEGVVKRFDALLANDVAYFAVHRGEVVALLGENGAGKSTLCKILCGYYRPDAGTFRVDGREVSIATPRDAHRQGIGMVFQDFSLVPALSVWENVALFLDDLPWAIGPKVRKERMRVLAERLHFTVDFKLPVGRLAVGDRQKVEILKQLMAGARVLVLDEPTKVLAPQESEGLFRTIAELRADGYGIIYITHKLHEVAACADRVAVMRQGKVVSTLSRAEANEERLLALMFGEATAAPEVATSARRGPDCESTGEVILSLDGVDTARDIGVIALDDISLELRGGEILGVAGVTGNGQRELADLILGLRRASRGIKRLLGHDATAFSPARIRGMGVASIPDDPLALAVVPGLSVRDNLALGSGRRYRAGLDYDWLRLAADMRRSAQRLRVPEPPLGARAAVLSGGNQQRVVLIRELAHDPKLIVALYPTRGLDARSAQAVCDAFITARAAGAGVLLVSDELDELFAMSDRLIVLRAGRISGDFAPEAFRADLVGPCMVGADAA